MLTSKTIWPCRAGRQGPHKLPGEGCENGDAGAGVLRRGFARADVGWCYEICLCVDICRRAARRNASAAARKTSPGIAAPAGVPRPVPPSRHAHFPNRQAHLARHACGLPHRAPPASRVWRSFPWPRSDTSPPRPERRNRRLSYPPPSHKACLGNKDRAAAYRTVRAGLLARAGAGRPAPTRNWFEFIEWRVAPHSIPPYGRQRRKNATKARLFLGRSQEPALGQLQRLAPLRAPPDANWQRPAALP